MTIENLEKANEIQYRLGELHKMNDWFEEDRSISLIASGCNVSQSIPLSCDMKTIIYNLCVAEILNLEKEFERL